jgi:hypothetical protein
LIKYDGAIFSLLVLKSIGIQEEDSNQIEKNYSFKQTMKNPNYAIDGQSIPHFFERLRWQLVDGQHVIWACKNAKTKLEKMIFLNLFMIPSLLKDMVM